jgi:uncharacterized protein YjgD (DUF1641 family)
MYKAYLNECKKRGIKVGKDSFDENDENVKQQVEMIKEISERGIIEDFRENWKQIFQESPFSMISLLFGVGCISFSIFYILFKMF